MDIKRPDLSQVDPDVRAYIESLEAELERRRDKQSRSERNEAAFEINEPPTSLNMITISAMGLAKRTPRHLYSRQRRGGMGVFDLEISENDTPATLTIADEKQDLLLITNQARAHHWPANYLPESPLRSRGQDLTMWPPLTVDEHPLLALPQQSIGYLVLVTQTGQVRRLRYHFLAEDTDLDKSLYNLKEFGPPAAACWTAGDDDLFIASRQGRAIRFAEQQVPFQGCLGLRLSAGDAIVAVTGVRPESGVFLLGADGKGIIRLMSGFRPNKAPGSGGKIALKTDHLVGAITVDQADDIFIISRLSKIVRFQAAEVSTTEGAVRGVNCIALRADEAVAVTGSDFGF